MKEIRQLKRSLHFLSCIHLALLTLCLSFSIALLYPGSDLTVCVLWAVGAVIPVQLIHQICLRVPKSLSRYLLCAAVTALAVLLPDEGLRRAYYGICCIPILISGLWFNRPNGKLVFTVPKIHHLMACLLLHSLGKISRSSVMAGFAIALFALMTLTICVYRNQEKVMHSLWNAGNEEVSHRSIIVLNRRVMALFAILGALILAAVPWLLQWQGERVAPVETQGTAAAVAVTTTEFETVTKMPTDIVVTTAGEPLDYSGVGDVLTWLFVAVIGCILVLIVVALVLGLLSISDGNPKHTDPEPDQTWTLERLEPGDLGEQAEEPAVGYEKKLRRRYQKLIRGRSSGKAKLSSMTPEELERAAKLEGPGADMVHKLYEQTRYGPGPTDKERYTAFREAERSLDPPKHETQESG
ncbi:MAG: DUF4129 domain-containing protein [Oscillospiraceae bacterium]|nr:DUF4129 domain-containing protein [Oscillospiraceae bacterium]